MGASQVDSFSAGGGGLNTELKRRMRIPLYIARYCQNSSVTFSAKSPSGNVHKNLLGRVQVPEELASPWNSSAEASPSSKYEVHSNMIDFNQSHASSARFSRLSGKPHQFKNERA